MNLEQCDIHTFTCKVNYSCIERLNIDIINPFFMFMLAINNSHIPIWLNVGEKQGTMWID